MRDRGIRAGTVGAAALALLAFGAAACSSSSSPAPPGTSKFFTSTTVNAHTHTIILAQDDLDNPPAQGLSRMTTSATGHTHSFAMTQAQLMTVAGGTPVTITTGSSDVTGTHTHDFTISKWF
jgi:hypothetical protein